MKIYELPEEICNLLEKRTLEQGRLFIKDEGVDFYEEEDLGIGGCDWSKTPEGHSFWLDMNNGVFDRFYQLYPLYQLGNVITSKSCTIYYGQAKGRKFKVTIEYE